MSELLRVENLHVHFQTYLGNVYAVRGVDLSIHQGESVAIVGESGCGKSVMCQAIMGMLASENTHLSAEVIDFDGHNLLSLDQEQKRLLRGAGMSMIFQNPMTSLNPTMKVSTQIIESIQLHRKLSYQEARQEAIHLLKEVGISHGEKRLDQFPHQFSGGMRQRVMIAIAIAARPKLIFADEPTTALDVTIQAQILQLLSDLRKKMGTSIVLVTHDLAVVANTCDRVFVMYAGQIVESGTVEQIFYRPQHPYTQSLLRAIPCPGAEKKDALESIPGSPPDLHHPPPGCGFHPRCTLAMKRCASEKPPLHPTHQQQLAACWIHDPRAHQRQTQDIQKRFDLWSPHTTEIAQP